LRVAFPTVRFPVVGQVYTIRDVRTVTHGANAGRPSLFLVGLENPVVEGFGDMEPGMPISAFRPLITKTQEEDVAQFRHLLSGLPVGEDA
jgi:hypothetical protein